MTLDQLPKLSTHKTLGGFGSVKKATYKSGHLHQGAEGRSEQHRGLRTKALMRDLGTRLHVDKEFL